MGPVLAGLVWVLASGLSAAVVQARATSPADGPALPGPAITEQKPESPIDPDVTPQECDACHKADETSGRIPLEAIHIDTRELPDGVAVRATADDADARDLLWKAAVARGELVQSLRNTGGVHLCAACKARAEALRNLNITARRIPEGVEMVYTSASPDLVRQIRAAARSATQFDTVRF